MLCVGCPLRNFLITPPLHTAWGGGLAAPLGRMIIVVTVVVVVMKLKLVMGIVVMSTLPGISLPPSRDYPRSSCRKKEKIVSNTNKEMKGPGGVGGGSGGVGGGGGCGGGGGG